MNTINALWKPIHTTVGLWVNADVTIIDSVKPSWDARKKEISGTAIFDKMDSFQVQLMREQAIETGIVEKLYSLSRGVTETFIQEGFVEAFVSHDDTNINPTDLIDTLKNQYRALEFAFETITEDRPFTEVTIRELHQIVCAKQDTIEVFTNLNNTMVMQSVKLKKGVYKTNPNNPRRQDSVLVQYAPPEETVLEMKNLVEIYNKMWDDKVSPVIIAAWLHHSFTMIHPFQDGNGRLARILASLVLVKGGLFPFIVKREKNVVYIDALEKADIGDIQCFVDFVAYQQAELIDQALNYQPKAMKSLSLVAGIGGKFVELLKSKDLQKKKQLDISFEKNRSALFGELTRSIGSNIDSLLDPDAFNIFNIDKVVIDFKNPKNYYYNGQIIQLATSNDYYFRKQDPRAWVKNTFYVKSKPVFSLFFTFHHFGYESSAMKIGVFIIRNQIDEGDGSGADHESKFVEFLSIRPLTISLLTDSQLFKSKIDDFVQGTFAIAMNRLFEEFK